MTMLVGCGIPQEIYDLIVNELRNDKPSLKACSLVASAWRATPQRLLYRKIVLRTSQSLPRHGPRDVRHNPQSPMPYRENQTLLFLNMPVRLLQHIQTFIIRGDRANRDRCGGPRMPDPFLAGFLGKIRTLMFPSLVGVEICDVEWSCISPKLRRALITLVSGRYVKEVSMVNCEIPLGVQWLRFVGPETRSLTLKRVNPSMIEHETPIDDIPISAAPNLINLDLRGVKDSEISQWILRPSRNPGGPSSSVLRGCSWRDSVTTLSLQCCEGFLDLVRACSGLRTLKLKLLGYTIVPLDLIMRIPTLEHLDISTLSPEELPWIISSFKVVYLPPEYPYHPSPTVSKSMSISLRLSATFTVSPSLKYPDTLPPVMDEIRDLDDAVTSMRNVGVSLTMVVTTFRLDWAGLPSFKHDGTMLTLFALRTQLKALKLHLRWSS